MLHQLLQFRVPRDVESTVNVRVLGNHVKRRERGDEAIVPVRARNAVERAGGVVTMGMVVVVR